MLGIVALGSFSPFDSDQRARTLIVMVPEAGLSRPFSSLLEFSSLLVLPGARSSFTVLRASGFAW